MQPAIKSGTLFDEPLGQTLLKRGLITQSQLDEIVASRMEIAQGMSIENDMLDKEVKQWLNAR